MLPTCCKFAALQRAAAGHPNIVQLHEVFVTQHHVALVLEYANGGDLSQYIEHCMITEVRGAALPLKCLPGPWEMLYECKSGSRYLVSSP
jgi:serine/threonine protein kinase